MIRYSVVGNELHIFEMNFESVVWYFCTLYSSFSFSFSFILIFSFCLEMLET